MLASGLDKVRNDSCLHIWDINQRLGSGSDRPIRQLASSEAIAACQFTRDNPHILVAGVAYRWVRIFDLREAASGTSAMSCNSRCVYNISLDLDPNYYAGHSDDGVVTVWDRRFAKGSPTQAPEPALQFGRAAGDESKNLGIWHLRYSNTREGAFAVLNEDGGLRVYETAKILNIENPPTIGMIGSDSGIVESHKRLGWRDSAASFLEARAYGSGREDKGSGGGGLGGTSTSGSRTPVYRNDGGETLLVSRINDIRPMDRTSSGDTSQRIAFFDWLCEGVGAGGPRSGRMTLLTVKGDGSLEIIKCPGPAPSMAWGSRNEFAITCENNLKIMSTPKLEQPEEEITLRPRRKNNSELEDLDRYHYSGGESPDQRGQSQEVFGRRNRANSLARPEDFLPDARQVLQNDICVVMRKRVEAGYLMNCAKNAALVAQDNSYMEDMWVWLDGAHECSSNDGMMTAALNLSFLGVLGVWHGGKGPTPESRANANRKIRRDDWTAACQEINKRNGRKKFSDRKTDFPEQRRLCLAIAGCYFDSDELERELQRLEANGEHSKAAGLALFYGKIERSIKALQRGGRTLKLMSTAVAGYFATIRDPSSGIYGTWKELAGMMANELGDPYQRAIFAYISNSDWREVLDELGVPLRERIGIALRWLDDDELTNYLNSTTAAVIRSGELEGIILTGVTEDTVKLLQEYINRTGDVQTAALVATFGSPRYFKDSRVEYWIESYRQLLNSWRLFHARARFDVARGQASKDRNGAMTMAPPQRQVYVRCANCDRSISGPKKDPKKMTVRERQQVASTTPGIIGGVSAAKPTVCPHCKKSLPRCAVCLLTLGTIHYREGEKSSDVEKDYDRWWVSCFPQTLQAGLMKVGSTFASAVITECMRDTQRTGSVNIGCVQFPIVSAAVRCRLASA